MVQKFKTKLYSTLPNKRTYLNNRIYQKLSGKLITVPTRIAVPIGSHLHLKLVYLLVLEVPTGIFTCIQNFTDNDQISSKFDKNCKHTYEPFITHLIGL